MAIIFVGNSIRNFRLEYGWICVFAAMNSIFYRSHTTGLYFIGGRMSLNWNCIMPVAAQN